MIEATVRLGPPPAAAGLGVDPLGTSPLGG